MGESLENLRVQCVTQREEIASFRAEWESLWLHSRLATPFNTPSWLIPWWHTFGNGCLRVYVLRKENRMVGILPMYLLEGRLQFLGIGVSDYLDILSEVGLEQSVAAAALQAVTSAKNEWKEVEFQNLPDDSPLLSCRQELEWRDRCIVQDSCPAMALPGTVEGLRSVIPESQYKSYDYSRRRVEREGGFLLESSPPERLEEACDALFQLHKAQWNARGMPGAITEQAASFLREAIRELNLRDRVRFYLLRYQKEIVGLLLGFSVRRRFYFYISGVNPDFRKYGVGNLLVGYALQNAVERGDEIFDFLRGREDYKYAWGASDRPLWNRQLTVV